MFDLCSFPYLSCQHVMQLAKKKELSQMSKHSVATCVQAIGHGKPKEQAMPTMHLGWGGSSSILIFAFCHNMLNFWVFQVLSMFFAVETYGT